MRIYKQFDPKFSPICYYLFIFGLLQISIWFPSIQICCQQIQTKSYSVTSGYSQYFVQHSFNDPEGKKTTICCYLLHMLWGDSIRKLKAPNFVLTKHLLKDRLLYLMDFVDFPLREQWETIKVVIDSRQNQQKQTTNQVTPNVMTLSREVVESYKVCSSTTFPLKNFLLVPFLFH